MTTSTPSSRARDILEPAPTVPMMFDQVVVGVDGRPGGHAAIALALALARQLVARCWPTADTVAVWSPSVGRGLHVIHRAAERRETLAGVSTAGGH